MRMTSLIVILTLSMLLSACSPDRTQPPPVPKQDTPKGSPTVQLPEIDASRYEGPDVALDVLQREMFPPQCVAAIEITTPTGGWTLALDQAAVIGDTAKVFLTLERPGEGEMVTQALVTHRTQFVSSDPCFAHAEVYVHLAQSGVSTLTTNYRLAKKSK